MTNIKEIPILFQTEMTGAILKDRKTKTRRTRGLKDINEDPNSWNRNLSRMRYKSRFWNSKLEDNPNPLEIAFGFDRNEDENILFIKPPYGKPGDLLYVRENWRLKNYDLDDDELTIDYQAGGHTDFSFGDYELLDWVARHQQKLDKKGLVKDDPSNPDRVLFVQPLPWNPSIHLPKALSRIWLMVEDVQAERLQDISEEDAVAEGCSLYGPFGEYRGSVHPSGGAMRYRAYSKSSRAFQCIWEEINGTENWKQNPWVWAVKFRVLSKTGRPSDDIIQESFSQIWNSENHEKPQS